MRRGRGGRREERLSRSLAVRHEVLGVGPEHRLTLRSRRGKHTQNDEMGRRKETKEKVIRLAPLSSDGLFTVTSGRDKGRGPGQPSPGAPAEVSRPGLKTERWHPQCPNGRAPQMRASPALCEGSRPLLCHRTRSALFVLSGTLRLNSTCTVRYLVTFNYSKNFR